MKKKLIQGVTTLAAIVEKTYGPMGASVFIDRKMASPIMTKDGVTVAKSIFLEDPVEAMGAEIAKEAANRVDREVGDGTTTTISLIHSILKSIPIKTTTIRPYYDDIMGYLDRRLDQHRMEATNQHIESIASSASRSPIIGKMISQAVESMGHTGITIQQLYGEGIELKISDGFELNRGWIDPRFADQGSNSWISSMTKVLILSDPLLSREDMNRIVECQRSIECGGVLLIIVPQVSAEVLAVAIGSSPAICIVQAPLSDDKQLAILEDISIFTGGQVVGRTYGTSIDDLSIPGKKANYLGWGIDTRVTALNTVIGRGKGDEGSRARIDLLTKIISSSHPRDVPFYQSRIAHLKGSTAILYLGGRTDIETGNLIFMATDAIRSAEAALEGGVVPGSASIPAALSGFFSTSEPTHDDILLALRRPSTLLGGTDLQKDKFFGVNLETHELRDLVGMGILEPAKTVRKYVEVSLGAVESILSCGAVIYE